MWLYLLYFVTGFAILDFLAGVFMKGVFHIGMGHVLVAGLAYYYIFKPRFQDTGLEKISLNSVKELVKSAQVQAA
jgi:hypothetical protein